MTQYKGIEVELVVEVNPPITPELVRTWLSAVLASHQVAPDCELTCILTDDEQLRALNAQYRGIDEPTDVLSFRSDDECEFVTPEEQAPYLGDILISVPTAMRQAAEAGHSLERELALLTVHGCLHLLGHDHNEDNKRAEMWRWQDQLLEELGENR